MRPLAPLLLLALSACFAKGASDDYDASAATDALGRVDASDAHARDGKAGLGDAVSGMADGHSSPKHDASPSPDAGGGDDAPGDVETPDAGPDATTDATVTVDAGFDAGTDAHDAALPCGGLGSAMILQSGQSILSCDGRFDLEMQPTDGNLVLYFEGSALWSAATAGNPGAYAAMQGDGNFVVYSTSTVALWSSATAGNPGATLAVQSDGNLVVYSTADVALWSSGTGGL